MKVNYNGRCRGAMVVVFPKINVHKRSKFIFNHKTLLKFYWVWTVSYQTFAFQWRTGQANAIFTRHISGALATKFYRWQNPNSDTEISLMYFRKSREAGEYPGVGGIDFCFPQKAELAEKGGFYQYPRFCSTPQIVRFTSRETYDTSSVHSDRVLVTYERAWITEKMLINLMISWYYI